MKYLLCLISAIAFAGPPVITDLQPRGAQKGRPFTLTLVGRDLIEGARIWSTMPAAFTALGPEKQGMEGRYASFLVEPKAELAVGVYAVRVETPDGISNIQLFTVGSFSELGEEESRPGALPNSNDGIESAQSLPSTPITVNGTLRGPERDFFRVYAKAGEKRVFEVEARRCGSAIDPAIRLLDQSGKVIAKSEDSAMLGLDARLDVTFPREGYYYVELHDARFSSQTANFYRLKSGHYAYPQELFPLGGQRGKAVEVSMGGTLKVTADLRKADAKESETWVNLPDNPGLPLPFAIGDNPELTEPLSAAVALPVTLNGRVSKPGEIDRFTFQVTPGEWVTFQVQARELGTSKLMAVLTALDEKGNKLGRAGDEPLAEDVYNVNQSRTAGDPVLRVQAPKDAKTITLTIEDLALRGGQLYGYRVIADKRGEDFVITLNSPFINIPEGGSVSVPVTVERRGFEDDLQLRVVNAPKGLKVEGGFVVAGAPVKENARNRNSRGVLILTAEKGLTMPATELIVEGSGKLADGKDLVRQAKGLGMLVGVTGATLQGSVDRQRPVTAPWLGLELPAAVTKPKPATLEVTMLERTRMEEGDQLKFAWKWHVKDEMTPLPKSVSSDMVGAGDIRMIDAKQDPKDRTKGTFLITTTKLTRPSKYDVYITGRLMIDGQQEEVVSRPITVELQEVKSANVAETGSSR